jgi:hypothetical protein
MDGFGIKYVGKQHAHHLIKAMEENYEFFKDWAGQLFCGCGIKLNWDYTKRTMDLSMPGYIQATSHKFQHPSPKREQHAPHRWTEPNYGAKQQLISPEDTATPLKPVEIKRLLNK